MKQLPTQKTLQKFLRYDQQTGELRWRTKPCRHILQGKIAGTPHIEGYVKMTLHKESYLAHRVIWMYVYGINPPHDIDHVNGDRSDNRLCNLRLATRTENARNSALRRDNTSGVCGVSYESSRQRWQANITVNGQQQALGRFRTKEEAINARLTAENNHGFHENHGKTKEERQRASVS